VLLAVNPLGDEAYGMAAQQMLERETRRSVSPGPVYTMLDGLQALVRSATVAGTPTRWWPAAAACSDWRALGTAR
jgi:hypothetical protein